jgi:exopolysaccharide production protein ExoQ
VAVLLGCYHLRRPSGLFDSAVVRCVLVSFALYLTWAFASLAWSVEPALTLRRTVQLALILLATLGLGWGYYGGSPDGEARLVRHVAVAAVVSVVSLWVLLLGDGNVDILNPAWSAKAEGSERGVSYPVSFALIASPYMWRMRIMRPGTILVVVALALLTLFAQKVRLITAAALLVTLLHLGVSCRPSRLLMWLAAGALIVGVVALGGSAINGQFSASVLEALVDQVTLNQSSETTASLDGRTPLWDIVTPYAEERPMLGHGFGAFWSVDMLEAVWTRLHWRPPHAHNGYLDEILGTGIVGLALFLVAWVGGGLAAWWIARRTGDAFGTLVACWMLHFLLLNALDTIMQLYFQFPFYAALSALFVLLAHRAQRHAAPDARARPIRPRPGRVKVPVDEGA